MSEGRKTGDPTPAQDGCLADMIEALELWRKLDNAQRDAFRVWARWACDDRRPETNPLKTHPLLMALNLATEK